MCESPRFRFVLDNCDVSGAQSLAFGGRGKLKKSTAKYNSRKVAKAALNRLRGFLGLRQQPVDSGSIPRWQVVVGEFTGGFGNNPEFILEETAFAVTDPRGFQKIRLGGVGYRRLGSDSGGNHVLLRQYSWLRVDCLNFSAAGMFSANLGCFDKMGSDSGLHAPLGGSPG